MSDHAAALTPLHRPVAAAKKRKRAFRPKSQKKGASKASSLTASTDSVADPPHETVGDTGSDHADIERKNQLGNEGDDFAQEDVEPNVAAVDNSILGNKPKSVLNKSRVRPKKKSKKVGISIGPARSTASSSVSEAPDQEDKNRKKQTTKAKSSQISSAITTGADEAAAADRHDAAILSEEVEEGVKRMGAFCTRFKAKKPSQRQGETAAPPPQAKEVEEEPAAPSGPVVQIINGEIVLQESSVVINGNVKRGAEDEAEIVEEDDQLAVVGASYSSFSTKRQTRTKRWTAEETKKFYVALRQLGTDFGTMEVFFLDPKRTRRQLKRKYEQELINNPVLVDKCMDPGRRMKLDLSLFQLSEEEQKRIDEPPPPEEKTEPTVSNENAAGSSATKQKITSNPEEEEEAIEEDALEEARMALPEVPDTFDPMFGEDFGEPEPEPAPPEFDPFAEEEDNEAAAVSLVPTLGAKKKKKANFKTARRKKKK